MAENAEAMGQIFRDRMNALRTKSELVTLVRGKGLLNAIVIIHEDPEAAWKLCLELKENGLLAKPTHGDKIRFAPPLIITKSQIEEAVIIIGKSLKVLE